MIDQLKYLIELQFIEDKKAELLRSREETPLHVANLEQQFAHFESDYLLKKEEYEQALKMRRSLEHTVKDLETKQTRSKGRTNEVKTNREYQALLKEIDDLKQEITLKEDQILEYMEAIDRLDKEVKKLAAELEQRRKQVNQDKEQLQLQSQQVDEQIAKLNSLQQELRARLDPDIVKRYDFLCEKRSAIAVAAVQNGVCQVCRLNIPPQKFIDVQRDEIIHQCPHCQRFIYWSNNEAYQVFADDFGI